MKLRALLLFSLCATMSLSLSMARPTQSASAAPAFDGGVRDVLYAVPFRIEEPYTHAWRREAPLVTSGYVCVLAVDPALVVPTELEQPVLYAGDTTVERLHPGAASGHVVVVIPSTYDAQRASAVDLHATPIWFGAPALPEQIGASEIASEHRAAERRGLRPLTRGRIDTALARGGTTLVFGDRVDLDRHAAALILEYAPEDADFAQGMLVPRLK
ncbi:MAG: hypothetical protein ACKVWV_19455 [Planctomycetota bacterium]